MSKPTDDEIGDVLDFCSDAENEGVSSWPGMTYEQGVEAAVRWMMGQGDSPIED